MHDSTLDLLDPLATPSGPHRERPNEPDGVLRACSVALRRGLASTRLILGAAALVAACSDSSPTGSELQSNMPGPGDDSSPTTTADMGGEDAPAATNDDASSAQPGADDDSNQNGAAVSESDEDPTAGIDDRMEGEGEPAPGDGGEDAAGNADPEDEAAGDDPMVDEGNDPEPAMDAEPQVEPEPEPAPDEPAAFAPCPTDGSPCAIMPLGDSITDGVGSSGGGYRVELFRQFLQNGKNATFVGTQINGPNNVDGQPFPRAHQGHSGFTISGGGAGSLLGRWDAAIDVVDPHVVLLLIGTNDINGNVDVGNAPTRLGALLDQITSDAPDALVVVAQIIPITVPATNARVIPYNNAMVGVVQQRIDAGQHLQLLDMYSPFADFPNFQNALMNDFLHPNDTGYVVMGQTWFQAIESVLPE